MNENITRRLSEFPYRVYELGQRIIEKIFKRSEPPVLPPVQTSRLCLDVSLGSGGMQAAYGGTGFVLLLRVAGLDELIDVVMANSGSFVPGLCLSDRSVPTEQMLKWAIQTDVGSLVSKKTGKVRRLWALLRKQRLEVLKPSKGVFCPRALIDNINERSKRYIGKWPDGFMTIATSKDGHTVVLASDGVYKYLPDGKRVQLAPEPPTLGEAAAAAGAIPGIIDAQFLFGEWLFDGVHCGDGRLQIRPITQHYGNRKRKVIAFDVGEDAIKRARWLRWLWIGFSLFRGAPIDPTLTHPEESEDLIIVKCKITGFHGLKFHLEAKDKWRAIIQAYLATARRLRRSGWISRETHPQVYDLANCFRHALRHEETLPSTVEKMLAERGLW